MDILALGPEGTNGHEAATRVMKLMPESSHPIIELCDSHALVFERIVKEPCIAVVPVENSIEGFVADTVRGFWLKRPVSWSGTSVIGEVELPIEHLLVMRHGREFNEHTPVFSHPQALGQCRENLKMLGFDNLRPVNSTAGAGKLIATDDAYADFAALVPPIAAKTYELHVLRTHMGDMKGNVTRFHVLGHTEWPPTADCKTALIFWMHDVPHALMNATWAIGAGGANMSSIQFFPLGTPGSCAFYAEFNEHVHSKEGAAILKRLETVTDRILWLGSFPQEHSIPERDFGAAQVQGGTA